MPTQIGSRRPVLNSPNISLVAQIPYGKTKSYGQIGLETGLPARAVGALLRQCPVVLFIPTHRVIHADGRVGGFAGQSWLKAKLLDLEGALTGSG